MLGKSAITVRVGPKTLALLNDTKPESLSLTAYCTILLEQAAKGGLTFAPQTQTMGEPAARRASYSSSTSKTSNRSISMSIPAELEPQSELIREFWKTKKGSRGQVAWKLLIGELEKIRAAYGLPVVGEQLELAINGKWQGVTLKNYEQFKPKAAANEPQHRHPASQVFTAKDFDIGPASNPVIGDLF